MANDAAVPPTAATGAGSIDPRLANSAKLRLYLVFRRVVNPALLLELRSEHLGWMLDKEREGVLFLSGPITKDQGDAPYNGLTVIRAGSLDEARRLIETEPYLARRAMTYEIAEWTVYEGSLPLTFRLSDSTGQFS